METPLQILHLEDDLHDSELARETIVREGIDCEITRVDTQNGFLEALDNKKFDLILADYSLPSFDGFAAMDIARSRCPETPFIIISGTLGEEMAIDAMKGGATDYVLKQRMSRLTPAIVRAIRETNERLERRQAQEALRLSEARLRLVMTNMPVMLDALDENRNIVVWNRECERVTGYSAAEIVNNPRAIELLYPGAEYREQMLADWEVRGNEFHNWELEITCKNGEVRTISWSNLSGQVPIPGWESWAVGVDVTEQKRLGEQLLQAQKMESIGQLAGGVAHDFNNLLAPILVYSDLLLQDIPFNDPRHSQVIQIRKAGERARGLTRQLLAFGRRQLLELQNIDLNVLVGDFQKMLTRTLREDIQIQFHPTTEPCSFRGDASQLEQILMNLAVNAQDAMPDRGTIIIETAIADADDVAALERSEFKPGEYILLTFSDTGDGMAPEIVDQIFEPFYTTKERGKGTGLGLSTTYGIIKQHGGFVLVYSEPDRGTTFKIYFPRIRGEEDLVVDQTAPPEPKQGNETILLAEDDPDVREMAVQLLTHLGYTVLEASDGPIAVGVARLHNGPIHLLITDVIMPEMTGNKLYSHLLDTRPEMKVLYMSGYAGEAIAYHDVLEEGVEFIHKPFTALSVAEKIREILDENTSDS